MISDENVNNQSKDSIDKKKKVTQPLKRYISAVKSLLSPISSNSSTSLQDLLSCEAPVDKYFESIEQILKKKCEQRTPVDTQLIAGYLTYLSDFYQVMNKHYTDKTKEIFNKIAVFMYYIELPSDTVISSR